MGRSAIDCLSGPACGKERNQAQGADLAALLARFARKTGRRLTSDPIRTSLGLLPSGPDPVGEWLVHRQSPGPYLGPKGPESKRGGRGLRACAEPRKGFSCRHARPCAGHPRPFPQFPAKKDVDGRDKPGHDEEIRMPSDASAWSLHSQLKKDTIDIGDLPLCKVLVIKDAHYPWLLLVPRREGAVEIIDLDEVAQAQLMTEISRVSRALKEVTKCDKLNVAALGNLVPQLHVHVIARRTSDAAWPRPVRGVMPPLAHDAEEVQNFINALRRKIWLG